MRPILFHLGPFPVFAFGAMIALGVLLSIWLISRRAAKLGFPPAETAVDSVYVAVASGFIGGRLLFILQNPSYYMENPLKVFALWEGGLIFYGGVAGAMAGIWIFARIKKLPVLGLLDFLLPFEVLTHGFGRLGCFLNGCCYGKACNLPWAVKFIESSGPVHPVQLYEAGALFALFFLLNHHYAKTHGPVRSKVEGGGWKKKPFLQPSTLHLPPREKFFDGEILALYFMLYGVIRFMMEFFRDNPSLGPLTYNQWISLALIAAGGILYFVKGRKHASAA